jgi:hypothetical protein
MSCATPDAVGWFSGRDDGDVELLEGEEYWLFIGFSTTSTNVACL